MPQRVSKEERIISMVIEKAREAKELLYLSLTDNNRNPMPDKSEVVKIKRPSAETPKNLIPVKVERDGPAQMGYGFGGQMTQFTKAMTILKELIKKEESNPFLDRESNKRRMESLEADLEATNKEMDKLLADLRAGRVDQKRFTTRMSQLIGMLEQFISTSPFQGEGGTVLRQPNRYR